VKDVYNENNKTLKKTVKEDMRRGKDLPHSPIGSINIVKMAIHQRQSIGSMQFPSKYQ
jgi:hypothetical protein